MKKNKGFFRLCAFCILIGLLVSGCSAVPLTGRMQLALLPDTEMNSMGLTAYGDFLKNNTISNNVEQTQLVKNVGKNIAIAVENYLRKQGDENRISGFKWEFNLIENKTVNAWAMPGGKVAVYTGILPYTKTPEGLAVVISHEIAHVIARHGNERMSQSLLAQAGGIALQAALAGKSELTKQALLTAYGIGSTVGVILPFSRAQEYEADHLGLLFMAMAGYNPNTAVDFWTRMSAIGGCVKSPEYLSTHPSDQNRVENIKKMLPEAMKYKK